MNGKVGRVENLYNRVLLIKCNDACVCVSRSVSCTGLLNFFVNACMLVEEAYCIHGVVALLTLNC